MRLVNKTGKVVKFHLYDLPGHPPTHYVVEPGNTCDVPEKWLAAVMKKAPGLEPYTEPPPPAAPSAAAKEEFPRPRRRKKAKAA